MSITFTHFVDDDLVSRTSSGRVYTNKRQQKYSIGNRLYLNSVASTLSSVVFSQLLFVYVNFVWREGECAGFFVFLIPCNCQWNFMVCQNFFDKLTQFSDVEKYVLQAPLSRSPLRLTPWPEPLPDILPSLVSVCLLGPRRCFVYLLYTLFLSFFFFFFLRIHTVVFDCRGQ